MIVDFEESKRRAENINIDSVSINPQDKKSGNKNNEKDDRQVNAYGESEATKSMEENASGKNETGAISYYLRNLPLVSTPLGKYSSDKLVIDQSAHNNRAGAETTPLSIITEEPEECCRRIATLRALWSTFGQYGQSPNLH